MFSRKKFFNGMLLVGDLIIKYEKDNDAYGAILSIDFKQAFDNVDNDYLWKVLEKFIYFFLSNSLTF